MKVQASHLVQREHVDEALYVLRAKKVTAHVEHHSAPLVSRRVGDVSGWYSQLAVESCRMFDVRRKKLTNRLHTVEETRRGARGDPYRGRSDRKIVPFVTQGRVGLVE